MLSHPAPLQILTPPLERTSRLAPSKQSSLTPNNQHVSSRFELTSPLHLFACQVPADDGRPAASALVVDVSHFIGYVARAAVVRAIFELKEERRKETYMWLGNPLLYARIPGTQNKSLSSRSRSGFWWHTQLRVAPFDGNYGRWRACFKSVLNVQPLLQQHWQQWGTGGGVGVSLCCNVQKVLCSRHLSKFTAAQSTIMVVTQVLFCSFLTAGLQDTAQHWHCHKNNTRIVRYVLQ